MYITVKKDPSTSAIPQANNSSYEGVGFEIQTDVLKDWYPKKEESIKDFLFEAMIYNNLDCDASTIGHVRKVEKSDWFVFITAETSITEEEVARAFINHFLAGGCRETAIYTKEPINHVFPEGYTHEDSMKDLEAW